MDEAHETARRYRHVVVLFVLSAFAAWLSFDIYTQVAGFTSFNWFYAFRAAWIVEGAFALIVIAQLVARWWPESSYHTPWESIVLQVFLVGSLVAFQALLLTNVQLDNASPVPWLVVFAPLYLIDAFVIIVLAYNTWFFRYVPPPSLEDGGGSDDDADVDIPTIVPTRRLAMLWLFIVAWTAFTVLLPLDLACTPCMPDALAVAPLFVVLLDALLWIVLAWHSHRVQRLAVALFFLTWVAVLVALVMAAVNLYSTALAIAVILFLVWMGVFAFMAFFKCSMRTHVVAVWNAASETPPSVRESTAATDISHAMPMGNLWGDDDDSGNA